MTPESGLLTANGKISAMPSMHNFATRSNRCTGSSPRLWAGADERSASQRQSLVKEFRGKALRWEWRDGVVELTLDREPLNEIGTVMLADLERFVAAFKGLAPITSACIITSARPGGFCAGADLKELYHGAVPLPKAKRLAGVRAFLKRIHAVANAIDDAPFVTFAAVHGLCMGGGLELALVCDLIVADKMARFGFPELRLGLIPGFGGIPRLAPRCWATASSAICYSPAER